MGFIRSKISNVVLIRVLKDARLSSYNVTLFSNDRLNAKIYERLRRNFFLLLTALYVESG